MMVFHNAAFSRFPKVDKVNFTWLILIFCSARAERCTTVLSCLSLAGGDSVCSCFICSGADAPDQNSLAVPHTHRSPGDSDICKHMLTSQ